MFRIKICGVTSREDARAAVDAGADAIGLNFFPQSPRFVEPAQAAEITAVLPAGVARVGVFVEPEVGYAQSLVTSVPLDFIQIHGAVSSQQIAELGASRVIVAVPFSEQCVAALRSSIDDWRRAGCLPAALLLDAERAGLHGGTGQTIDWQAAAALRRLLFDLPLVLAGGLRPENVGEAVRLVRPHAVDVASGVESSPGRKDAERMRAFAAAAHGGRSW